MSLGGDVPAGGRPGHALQGRRPSTSRSAWSRRRRGTSSTARCASRKAERTVCTLIIPNDVQEEKAVEAPPREHGAVYSGIGYAAPRVVPPAAELDRAAEILNAGEKVAILVGQGALGAEDEVVEAAELLGAGVAKALLGRAVLPDDLPFVTGSIGLLGTRPSYELMSGCDTLLIVGSSFPYSEWLPKEGQARGVQIDIDPKLLSIRYPVERAARRRREGDAAASSCRGSERKEDRSWREEIEGWVEDWWRLMEDWAHAGRRPDQPAARRLGALEAASRRLHPRRGLRLVDDLVRPRPAAAQGHDGVALRGRSRRWGRRCPYAIAAKFAYPERPVIAFVGDGAFQMNGMNELITVAKYHERWSDQRLVFCVFNNRDLNMVTWEQRVMAGDPMYPATQRIPDFPAARYAELVGLHGVRVERPGRSRRSVGGGARRGQARRARGGRRSARFRRCRRTSAASR